MKQLEFTQFLPLSIEEAWQFFATPNNLQQITPGDIHFRIINELPEKIYPGLIINYQIKVAGLSFRWVTEITNVNDFEFFADEQLHGPYKYWRHEHYFKKTGDGVIMTDKIFYKIGWSLAGWMAGKLFVHKKVEEIFHYRYKKLDELFPKKS